MRRNLFPVMMLALAAGCSGRSDNTDEAVDPKPIIEKAIKAQGGEEKLSQFKAERSKGQGTMTMNGQKISVTLETIYQMPDKYKTVMLLQAQGRKIGVTQVLNGDQG